MAVKRQGAWVETGYAWVSLILAAAMLLVGLARYPVQVTPDEVYPSLRAVELIENDFKGADGALLPAFLPGSTPFGIGSNAYLQVLPQLLRPNTLIWIRGCNAVLALLAGLLLAYWMRIGLKSKFAWLLLPLLTGIPAWFTFARSGLDIALAASLLTGALASYGLYRSGRDHWIYAAVGLAWLGFYAHPAARLAVPVAVVMSIILDWRYHWSHKRVLPWAMVLAGLMSVPLVIFLLRHPNGIGQELASAGSFLVSDAGGWLKTGRYLLAFVQTFNPFNWLLVDPNLAPVYRTGPYPPLPVLLFPFIVLGGWITLKRIRQPNYRLIVGWTYRRGSRRRAIWRHAAGQLVGCPAAGRSGSDRCAGCCGMVAAQVVAIARLASSFAGTRGGGSGQFGAADQRAQPGTPLEGGLWPGGTAVRRATDLCRRP